MCGHHHRHRGHGSDCCDEAGHGQHDCCCARRRHHGEDCGCGGHAFGFQRRFTTRDEEIQALEGYLSDLEAEAQGVRERLAELRGA